MNFKSKMSTHGENQQDIYFWNYVVDFPIVPSQLVDKSLKISPVLSEKKKKKDTVRVIHYALPKRNISSLPLSPSIFIPPANYEN